MSNEAAAAAMSDAGHATLKASVSAEAREEAHERPVGGLSRGATAAARAAGEASVEEARRRLAALRGANKTRQAWLEGLPAAAAALDAAAAPLVQPVAALAPRTRHARYARGLGLPGPLYNCFSLLEAAAEQPGGDKWQWWPGGCSKRAHVCVCVCVLCNK